MKRQTARLGTIILVLLTLIGGVAHAQRPARVRLGLPVESLDGLALFVAQNRGFFTEQGIEAEITILRGGTGVIQTLVSGDIDIGMVGPVEVSLLRDKGVDVRLAMTTIDVPPFSLVVSREASITSVAGLRGRSIGVTSPGSLTYGLARYFVLKAGLQPDKDVTLLSLGGGPEMVGAFKAKRSGWRLAVTEFQGDERARAILQEWQEATDVRLEDDVDRVTDAEVQDWYEKMYKPKA